MVSSNGNKIAKLKNLKDVCIEVGVASVGKSFCHASMRHVFVSM